MKYLNLIPAWLKNKYFLCTLGFAAWMLFFDPRDVFTQWQHRNELDQLQASKAWYQKEIAKESVEAEQLKTNPSTIEKYARENFMMKRENEDLFIISEKPVVDKK